MPTVRNKFHELGNYHNKISLAAIVTREALTKNGVAQLKADELKALIDKAVKNIRKIEQFVIDADKTIGDFKPFVYKNLNPDVEIPSDVK